MCSSSRVRTLRNVLNEGFVIQLCLAQAIAAVKVAKKTWLFCFDFATRNKCVVKRFSWEVKPFLYLAGPSRHKMHQSLMWVITEVKAR